MSGIRIRVAREEDAEELLELQNELARESEFLMLTLEEAQAVSVEQQREKLRGYSLPESPITVLMASSSGKAIGYLGYRVPTLTKIAHNVLDLAIGVRQDVRRQGVATALLAHAVKDWIGAGKIFARAEIRADNFPSKEFFINAGFLYEGVKKGYFIDGAYFDCELYRWQNTE